MFLIRDEDPGRALIQTQALLQRDDLTPALRGHVLREQAITWGMLDSARAASECMVEALRLDPANAWNYGYYADLLLSWGRGEEAEVRAREAIALDPHWWRSYGLLGTILHCQGRGEEALLAWEKACRMGHLQLDCAMYARQLLLSGRADEAREIAQDAAQRSDSPMGLLVLACFWALEGEPAVAMEFLQRSADQGLQGAEWGEALPEDQDLASVRDDPRFPAILRQISENTEERSRAVDRR
jgi:tetratricopeptide (TPR) repeat protein